MSKISVRKVRLTDELDIVHLNIPTGVPSVFTFDENLNWVSDEYLGDQDEIAKKIAGVAAQGKK